MAAMVRHHHEHWDGTGYPDALAGEQIPLSARVLCIADVFTALTSRRSYRRVYTQEEALAIMERESGTTFDPELFQTFRALVEAAA
jgi:HD-GYP domain-containing protein (c-di-GMP phosphodiesterase class II)